MSYYAVPPMALPPVPPPPPPPPPMAPAAPRPYGAAGEYDWRFDYVARDLVEGLDRDRNGRLDRMEFRSANQARLDLNGDGVSAQELAAGLRAAYDEATFAGIPVDSELARRGAWNAAGSVRGLASFAVFGGLVASGITAAFVGLAPVALAPMLPFAALAVYFWTRYDARLDAGLAMVGGYVDALLERRPLPALDFAQLASPTERWIQGLAEKMGKVIGAPLEKIKDLFAWLLFPIWFWFMGEPTARR